MWATGVLYDNHDEQSAGQVLLINRGDFGSGHGWGAAHSTVWKYDSEMLVQKPPTAQNYGISNQGHFRRTVYFPGLRGVEELKAGELTPNSLYEAQLCDRLVRPIPTFNGFYRIMARHSDKAVVVEGASTADNARVIQFTYGGARTNDEWAIVSTGSGYFRIINRNSGKALAVENSSMANAAQVVQVPSGGESTHDQWAIVVLGEDYYQIVNRNSGKVLDVYGEFTTNNTSIVQWPWHGGNNQQFRIISVP